MKQFRNMVYPYVAWIAVMIVAPMLMIVLYAFTTAGNDLVFWSCKDTQSF